MRHFDIDRQLPINMKGAKGSYMSAFKEIKIKLSNTDALHNYVSTRCTQHGTSGLKAGDWKCKRQQKLYARQCLFYPVICTYCGEPSQILWIPQG